MSSKRIRVGVLFGGRSVEHEISVISALQMISAMDTLRFDPVPIYLDVDGHWFCGDILLQRSMYKELDQHRDKLERVMLLPEPGIGGLVRASNITSRIPIDVFFPVFHGRFGEDGCIQGLFELSETPYVGCAVLAAALSMSKQRCKEFVQASGIPVLPGKLVEKSAAVVDLGKAIDSILAVPKLQDFPLFVKPNNSGSSIGIGRAMDRAELEAALAKVFAFDVEALVEPCMTEMFELNVSVIGGAPARASVIEMPVPTEHALTYEDKYLRGGKKTGESQGMASLTRVIDPVDLPAELRETVTRYALRAFEAIGCDGVARFDFIVDKRDSKVYFNELNSPPGSLAFYLWEKSHPRLLYTELIEQLIERAFERARWRASVRSEIEFKALKS